MFSVMRYPVLMEDEGYYHCLKFCTTYEEAEEYIKHYVDDSKGYFRKSDFFVMSDNVRPRGGMADTRDLKSRAPMARTGSTPVGGTIFGTCDKCSMEFQSFLDYIRHDCDIITIEWLPPGSARSWRRGTWK